MNHDQPDWQTITLAIRRHYKPLARVAIEINSEEHHLNGLARGDIKDTKYKTGCRLLKIYRDICAKLNKQPEWIADLDVNPVPVVKPMMRRNLSFDSPDLMGYTKPMSSLPELARKILNRSDIN